MRRGRSSPDGSYRMKVSLSGRKIELLNPLTLDTSVRLLGTNVSRRVISPDCDSYGDRVIVVVRGREQLSGVRLEVRKGAQLVRTVRVGRRARALAVSWPPYDGKRCTTAPDGRYRLRVIARDVPGNTRAVDLGEMTARGVVSRRPTARSSPAGGCGSASRPTRAACGSSSRGWEPARRQILARGTRAPAAVARVPATARGGVYVVSNRHAGRTSEALLAVRGATSRTRRSALIDGQPASVAPALPAAAGRTRHPLRRDHARDMRAGPLDGYKAVVVPAVGGGVDPISGIQLVTQRRRHQARARHVIPAAIALVGRRGLRRAAHGHGPHGAARRARAARGGDARPARLARRRRHAAGARRPGRGRARRWRSRSASLAARAPQRRPLILPFAVCLALPFRFPVHIGSQDANLLVPLYAVIGVAWLALVLDALRGREPVARCRRARLALPLLLLVAWEAPRWPGARARPRAPRRSPSTRCPSASCSRRSWRIRRRGRACRTCCASRSPSRSLRRRRRLPARPPRHLVEPQADGLERVQLVLPRQLDLLRPVDLRPLPGGDDRARLRGAAVRDGAAAARGRRRGGARVDRDPDLVLAVGVRRALRGRRNGARRWRSGGVSRWLLLAGGAARRARAAGRPVGAQLRRRPRDLGALAARRRRAAAVPRAPARRRRPRRIDGGGARADARAAARCAAHST